HTHTPSLSHTHTHTHRRAHICTHTLTLSVCHISDTPLPVYLSLKPIVPFLFKWQLPSTLLVLLGVLVKRCFFVLTLNMWPDGHPNPCACETSAHGNHE